MLHIPGGYTQYLPCFPEAQGFHRQAQVHTRLGDRKVSSSTSTHEITIALDNRLLALIHNRL